jgi:beta-N-acetylhexosaminidase
LALVVACAGCATAKPASGPLAPRESIAKTCASQTTSDGWVECTLSHMTLRDKVAQMVWPQLYGDYVSADAPAWRRLSSLVREQHVGGLIMSVGSPLEIAAKLNALQSMSDLPLLVSADLEAGAGFRARGGYFLPNAIDLGGAVLFPPEMALGATGDTTLAREQGRATAAEGRAIGITVDFSPVLDVNNNPANPVINVRSFGEQPESVAAMGVAYLHGIEAGGMIATGKHFPGHGDTGVNSHLALPVVDASRARLDTVELVPFRAAIDAGVGGIMTFHGAMPSLDSSGVPGTLSPLVLTGVLRDQLHFKGLIVTDAMDMRGVLDLFGAPEAMKRAVAAGADVLLMPADVPHAIDAVVQGVEEKRYDDARITESARRILALKWRLGLERHRLADLDSARAIVGDSAHVALASQIAERAVTLVRDSLNQVPLGRLSRGARVLSVTYAHRSDLGAGVTFDGELRRTFPSLRSEFVSADESAPDYWRILSLADSADVVVVSSYLAAGSTVSDLSAPQGFLQFVNTLVERGAHPIVVALGNPYLLQQVGEVPAYLIAWSGAPVSQRAAARALVGSAPIGGRLPISIPPLATVGGGLTRGALTGPTVSSGAP